MPRYQTMKGRRSSAGSAGTPTACPPSSRRCASSASPRSPRSKRWASRSSTRLAASPCCATPTSGRTTSPARPAGSTSTTTTRRSTSPTWSRCSGRSNSCGTRVSSTRATASCPTAGATRRRCPTTSCGMDDDVYRKPPGPGRHRRFPPCEGNDTELDGTYLLVWTTTPWTLPSNLATAVHPDVDYVVVESDGKRFLLAEARVAAYAQELGEDPDGASPATPARSCSEPVTRRRSRTSSGHENAHRRAGRRLRHHRRRHRRRAHRTRLR